MELQPLPLVPGVEAWRGRPSHAPTSRPALRSFPWMPSQDLSRAAQAWPDTRTGSQNGLNNKRSFEIIRFRLILAFLSGTPHVDMRSGPQGDRAAGRPPAPSSPRARLPPPPAPTSDPRTSDPFRGARHESRRGRAQKHAVSSRLAGAGWCGVCPFPGCKRSTRPMGPHLTCTRSDALLTPYAGPSQGGDACCHGIKADGLAAGTTWLWV